MSRLFARALGLRGLGVLVAVVGAASGCGVIGTSEGRPIRLHVADSVNIYRQQVSLGGDAVQDYQNDPYQQPYGEPPNSYRAYPTVSFMQPAPPKPVRQR